MADAAAAVASAADAAVVHRRASPQFPAPGTGVMATVNPGEYRVVLSVGGRGSTQDAFVIAGK